MSDLAATNCGCGCDNGCDSGCGCGNGGNFLSSGNGCCNIIWILLLLSCCLLYTSLRIDHRKDFIHILLEQR